MHVTDDLPYGPAGYGAVLFGEEGVFLGAEFPEATPEKLRWWSLVTGEMVEIKHSNLFATSDWTLVRRAQGTEYPLVEFAGQVVAPQ